MESTSRRRKKRRGTSPVGWIGILCLAVVAFWSVFDWALELFQFEKVSDYLDQRAGVGDEPQPDYLITPLPTVLRLGETETGGWQLDGEPIDTAVALSTAIAARRSPDQTPEVIDLGSDDEHTEAWLTATRKLCSDAGYMTKVNGKVQWTESGSSGRDIDVARASRWTEGDPRFSRTHPPLNVWAEELVDRFAIDEELAAGSVETSRRFGLHAVWTSFARRLHPHEADVLDLWLQSGDLPTMLPATEAGRAWTKVRGEYLAFMDADRRFLIEGMTPLDQVELPAFLPREPEVRIPADSPPLEILRGAYGSLEWRLGALRATSVTDLIDLLDREEIGPVFLEPGRGVTYGDVAITSDACRRAEVEPDFRREMSASPDSPTPVVEDRPVINIREDGLFAYKGKVVYDPTEPAPQPGNPQQIIDLLVGWKASEASRIPAGLQNPVVLPSRSATPLTAEELRRIVEPLLPFR